MPGCQRLATKLALVTIAMLASPLALAQQSNVDWSQPPVACVEDIIPAKPDRPCPDLSTVVDPTKEFPASLSQEEVGYWKANGRFIRYCRAQEVLAREAKKPGGFKPVVVQAYWMSDIAVANADEKVKAIYEASRTHKIPAHVLTGALYQESLLAELGITEDGSNYSCGVGQINLQEWCNWANKQSPEKKKKMGWPTVSSCSELPRTLVKPLYEIAVTRLNGLPKYRLTREHFKGIELKQVEDLLPEGSRQTQALRFKAVRSFIESCQNPRDSIAAKANELAHLYKLHISRTVLSSMDFYEGKNKFQRKCREEGYTKAYPLNTGWLLTVGIYNYGPEAKDIVASYNDWSTEDLRDPDTLRGFNVEAMVESVYWSGKWDPKTDRMRMTAANGRSFSSTWKKQCVLYNHFGGVVRRVTAADQAAILPMFKYESCESGVPERRQNGAGVKNPAPPAQQR